MKIYRCISLLRFRNQVFFLALSLVIILLKVSYEKGKDDCRQAGTRQKRSSVEPTEFANSSSQKQTDANAAQNALTATAIQKLATRQQRKKLILFYTTLWNSIQWPEMETSERFVSWRGHPCKVQHCVITQNKQLLPKADVVLFHALGSDMVAAETLSRISKHRHQKQIWIYFIHENPYNAHPSPGLFNGFFNWTMTYQGNADIVVPYNWEWGTWEKRPEPDQALKSVNHAKGKERLAFVIIGHCGLFRERYIKKLQEYVDVDVYGGCSSRYHNEPKICPRGTKECNEIKRKYKFYLAFENSFCRDYITEKFFKTILDGYAVPIVLGGADYKKWAIPNSYIDALEFETIEVLANHLKYLDQNDEAYNRYHKWRGDYVLGPPKSWSCEICRKINEERLERKSYDNLGDWYGIKANCGTRIKELFNQMRNSKISEPFTDEYIH